MENQDYTTTIMVEKSPKEVFNAINHVRGWWSGDFEGTSDKLDAEFTYTVPEMHYSKQKVTAFIPDKRICWHVLDASLSFTKNKSEWKGTDIVFEITPIDDKTEVHFTHKGLLPTSECFRDCSIGWSMLVNGNLFKLILTGKDQPSPW